MPKIRKEKSMIGKIDDMSRNLMIMLVIPIFISLILIKMSKKFILAGGGTAGHINPALAIIPIIKDHLPDAQFLYVGTPKGMEAKLVPMEKIDFAPMSVSGFQRKITPENIGRNIKAVTDRKSTRLNSSHSH